jgi:outer membrane translocation and assembly module TamA
MRLRNQVLTSSLLLLSAIVFLFPGGGASAPLRFSNYAWQQNVPCVFDNFVWFKDQEIIDEIRKDLPSFDGAAPESGDSVSKILTALERLLKKKGLPSQVEYLFSSGNGFQYRPEHVFTARDAKVPVCKVVFQNSVPALDLELQQAAQKLVKKDYSKTVARIFAEADVVQVYRKHGYLRAVARLAAAELDQSCKDQVAIKVTIEPGAAYVWNKAVWTGAQAMSSQALDAALAMKAGEPANGQKIDAGLGAVIRAYGKQGYATLQITPTPDFDDANKRMSLNVTIVEGPQFRMGNLSVLGLTDNGAKMFKELWRINTGELYDATYLGEFLKRLVDTGGIPADQMDRIKTQVKPDKRKLTVDVSIDFNAKF